MGLWRGCEEVEAAGGVAEEDAGEVGDECDAGAGGEPRECGGDRECEEPFDGGADAEAGRDGVGEAVAAECVAVESEDGAAGAEDGVSGDGAAGEAVDEAADPHLADAGECAGRDEERVEAGASCVAFQDEPDEDERDRVREQVPDAGVRVHARQDRPRTKRDRGAEYEQRPVQLTESECELEQRRGLLEDEHHHERDERFERRTTTHTVTVGLATKEC